MITIGSCFSGIGCFELGLQNAIPNTEVIWQIEIDAYCRKVLHKHWPNTPKYNDITTIQPEALQPPTIICGGSPCQDISTANAKGKGLKGEKSILYWKMWNIVRVLRPKIFIMENVPNITNRGLPDVLRSLAEIGYDAEWSCITAAQFGAPHRRERFFLIATNTDCKRPNKTFIRRTTQTFGKKRAIHKRRPSKTANTNCTPSKRNGQPIRIHTKNSRINNTICAIPKGFDQTRAPQPTICRMDDGATPRIHNNRLKALGNSIVPQCSAYIGTLILNSGVLDT